MTRPASDALSALTRARSLLTRGGWTRTHVAADEATAPCAPSSSAAVAYSICGALESACGGLNVQWALAVVALNAAFVDSNLDLDVPPQVRLTCMDGEPTFIEWEESVADLRATLYLIDRAIADARVA